MKLERDWGRLDLNYKNVVPLSDVVDLIGGGTPKTSISEYWGGDIPWLSVKDFGNDDRYVYQTEKSITNSGLNHSSTKLLQRDDIIVSARGTVGELAMIPFPMAFNQSCYGIRPKNSDELNNVFLYYLMKDRIQIIKNSAHGSVFDTITRDTFRNINVSIPDIDKQRKIASILSAFDDKIAENKKINHHLEQMAQSIFKSWFVNFEPFNGTMPSDWKVQTLLDNELCRVVGSGIQAFEGEKMYYATANVNGTSISSGEKIEFGKRASRANMQPSVNSVWFAKMKNSIKHLFLNNEMKEFINTSILSTGFCGLQAKAESFEYVSTYIKLPEFEELKDKYSKGTTQEAINQSDLEKFSILIPSNSVLNDFHSTTKDLYSLLALNMNENLRLTKIRDILLPKLMSGEITID